MHVYRLGELNLVLLNRYSLIRVPINESVLLCMCSEFSRTCVIRPPINRNSP